MPIIAQGDKVLVTGANGFLAVHVVDILLKKGYAVRGVVRSLEKADHIKQLFAKYGDRFELVVVEDITMPGAFDNVLGGISGIVHTASPFYVDAVDPKEIIDPAVNGTKSILETAVKHGSSVKRIVVTSSIVSVSLAPLAGRQYTEEDWNDAAVAEVEEQGNQASGFSKYSASKTLAERAAWEVYRGNKESIGWDMTTLNPPYIFGPVMQAVKGTGDLNTSALEWFGAVCKNNKNDEEVIASVFSWVDVRDIAEAHVVALEKPQAGGERIIFSAGPFTWQDFIEAAKEVAPDLGIDAPKLSRGVSDYNPSKVTPRAFYSSEKGERILGIKLRSKEECTRDTLEDFKSRGWFD